MKKAKMLSLASAFAMLMTSCVVISTHETTGNPIGTKVGYIKGRTFGKLNTAVAEAAKKGGITKIGSVDINYYWSLFSQINAKYYLLGYRPFGKVSIRVTGE